MLEHSAPVVCVAWSPDGTTLATGGGSNEKKVHLWEATSGQQIQVLSGHDGMINGVAWSADGQMLASCSNDTTIRLWDAAMGRGLGELKGHTGKVYGPAWSPNRRWFCSGSRDGTVRLWDTGTRGTIRTLRHTNFVDCVAWSPDGQHIASGSDDQTVRVWDAETGQQKYVLEGHTAEVVSVCFLDDGRLLASLGKNGAVIFWRTDTWAEVMRVDKIGTADILSNLAVHPTLPVMASRDGNNINIWDLDFTLLRGAEAAAPTIFYVNAKAVLLGDSGVGKSGLGIRIAEGKFRPTEGSTHGAQFWHFPTERLAALPPNVQAELTLWDLAGQPEYRLTHQLFLDDTDAALLLFDCSDPNDPFRGVPYWAKVLKKLAPPHAVKFLVSARCDVSPVTVERREINHVLAEYGLDEYFRTSAKVGEGIEALFQRLLSGIPWDQLPRTSTPQLFQVVREFLLERKAAGGTLLAMDEVRQAARERFAGRAATQAELDTVVQLLQSRGLVFRLDPRPGVACVLLKPELINQYGASIIQAARNHPQGIGAVPERDVLTGNLAFSGFHRLPQAEEALVLDATAELLIRHDLCFREMGYLVFPSQINVTRLPPTEAHPRTEVAYRFSGGIETIYASLVVRLSYTDYFRREDQWRYAVEFSRDGHRLGFSMQQVEEGTGELEIYFHPGLSEFDRVTFIRFVTDHLRTKGIDIQEEIRLYCPKCGKEVTNREAIEARIQEGYLDIPCQYCATAILIPKSIEERYRRDPSLSEKQQQLAVTVEQRTEAEVKQFRADQRQYTGAEDQRIHILHLSDLHLENEDQAQVYRTQLETDLIQELEVRRLEYLVISGDVANHSTEDEYHAAFAMLDGLVKHFGLDSSRVVIVPGNHDLNWGLSKKAYPFVYWDDLPTPLPESRYIPAGDAGALLRDDPLYRERFALFNTHLYRRVYSSQDYPPDYADQALWVERPEDRLLFLGLNSCWQLDHHFRDRASIYIGALTRALDRLQGETYDGWLKIAVWHHPVTGQEMMNDEFMQLLAVHGFQVCLHGHIHEAIEGFHKYDDRRGIRIVGAGTFGAPTREQVTGIPLQYNLLTFDPHKGDLTVQTRKKEKPNGAWSADARWGDKNNPKPWYSFQVRHYRTRG
jgi:GTPase SAR1 family protein/predicted phosphodiesterase